MSRLVMTGAIVGALGGALGPWVTGCGGGASQQSGAESAAGTEQRGAGGAREVAVVELHEPDSRIVTLRVVFDAGSSDDPRGQEGATALAARLQAEGGTRDLTYTELVAKLFPLAGELSVEAGRDQTAFIGRVHRDKLEEFYGLFRDVLLSPRMGAEDFQRLREETTAALTLELRGNDDEELGKEALQTLLYPGHPYGHPSLGTEQGLRALTLEGVRAQREAVLCRGRVNVGLAGGYPEGFAARVTEDMEQLPGTCRARDVLPATPPFARTKVLIVDKPEAPSTAISIGFPLRVTREAEDFAALALATSYLGQHRQFAGVLFQKMRAERGLNYGDYAYPEHFEQDGWSRFARPNVARRQQYFSIWIRPVEPDKAHFALREAMLELRRLADGGLDAAAFTRMQTFLDRYTRLFAMTESRRLGSVLDDRFYGLRQPYLDRLREAWRGLDAAKVSRVVREQLTADRVAIAIVHKDAARLAEALAADTPSPITYREPKSEEILEEDRVISSYRLGIARDAITVVPVGEMFR